jgi:hypothetical protein
MENKEPVNLLNAIKHKEIIIDSSNLVPISKYKNSYNITKPFTKPISKIF